MQSVVAARDGKNVHRWVPSCLSSRNHYDQFGSVSCDVHCAEHSYQMMTVNKTKIFVLPSASDIQ